jgi:hypothetical protein
MFQTTETISWLAEMTWNDSAERKPETERASTEAC